MEELEQVTQEAMGGTFDDVFSTPELETPPTPADAHRGVIQSVTRKDAKSGAVGMNLELYSTDAGFTDHLVLWLPRDFVANIAINPKELPEEEGNKQQTQYRIGVANSTKDATLQTLVAYAREAGRTGEGLVKPNDINEFISNYNVLLAGLEVVFTRQPDKNNAEPKYRNKLRPARVYNINVVNDPKALKNYRKAWE